MFFCDSCDMVVKVVETKLKCKNCGLVMDFPLSDPVVESFKVINTPNTPSIPARDQGNFVEVTCPECEHNKALFKEVQTRSADEAMTIFYRCVKCGHNWKQN
ncbi:RPOM [Enterospora canceri]|uniref:DNA-directed RNA polymerase subunit n=1 Tax=Enterospora canceri TaxID=1081671 RepID=A0A1Y1S7H0_9MICR|nr:RPOM [Enterospora canceri]